MGKPVAPNFHKGDGVLFRGTTDDPRDNGSQTVIIKVRGRNKWTKLTEPEYRVQLPSGIRVARESELAPAPTLLKPSSQAQGGTAANETALQTHPIPAAASGAVHTAQVVRVRAPATAKPADVEWPKPPLRITTYYRP